MTFMWWILVLLVNISCGSDACFEDSSDPACSVGDRSLIAMKHVKGTSKEHSTSNKAQRWEQTGCYTNPQCQRVLNYWNKHGVGNFRDNCLYEDCEKKGLMWDPNRWHRCWNEGTFFEHSFKGDCVPKATPQPTPVPTPEPAIVGKKHCEYFNVAADLIFLVDSSGSVGSKNIKNTAMFLKDVVKELPLEKDGFRVGIVQFSGMDKYDHENNKAYETAEIALKDGTTQERVNKALDNMRWHGAEVKDPMTYTGEAINYVLSDKAMFPSASKDAHKMLVIITDGKSNSRNKEFNVKKMADKAKEEDVMVIVVGIGESVNHQELKDMADGKKENMFEWKSGYSNMEVLAKMLKERTTDQLCTWVYPVTSRPTLAPTPEPTQAAEGYSECYMDEDFGKADKGCVIDPKNIPPVGTSWFRRRNSPRDFCIQNECRKKGLWYKVEDWKDCGGWKFKGYCHKR